MVPPGARLTSPVVPSKRRFGLFFIAGGGPPPAILPDAINTFIGYTPMGPLVDAYTTPWHVGGVDGGALVALAAVAVVAGVLAVMRLSRD